MALLILKMLHDVVKLWEDLENGVTIQIATE